MAELATLEGVELLSDGRVALTPYCRPKLTPEIVDTVLQSLRDGHSYAVAAVRAGITEGTLKRWRRNGRKGTHPAFVEFMEACHAAIAEAEGKHVDNITNAAFGRGDYKSPRWQASGWWLERRKPETYGKRMSFRHEGHDGGPVKFTLKIGDAFGDQPALAPPDEEKPDEATPQEADWEIAE